MSCAKENLSEEGGAGIPLGPAPPVFGTPFVNPTCLIVDEAPADFDSVPRRLRMTAAPTARWSGAARAAFKLKPAVHGLDGDWRVDEKKRLHLSWRTGLAGTTIEIDKPRRQMIGILSTFSDNGPTLATPGAVYLRVVPCERIEQEN